MPRTAGDTPEIPESQLHSWKLLGEFRKVLDKVAPTELRRPAGGPERLLSEDDYLASFLFAQFNPVIDTVRGLSACSDFERVQEEVWGRHLSLGSFSEAQHVFGSGRLKKVFAGLLEKSPGAIAPPPGTAHTSYLKLIDSTVMMTLPRMDWADWRHQGKTQRAVRLHLKLLVARNLLLG